MSREKVAQHIVVKGYPGRERLVRDDGGRQGGSVQLLGALVVKSILAKFGQTRPYNLMIPA